MISLLHQQQHLAPLSLSRFCFAILTYDLEFLVHETRLLHESHICKKTQGVVFAFGDLLRRPTELRWCMVLVYVAMYSLNRSCRSDLCVSAVRMMLSAVSMLGALRRPWSKLIHMLSIHKCSLEELDG